MNNKLFIIGNGFDLEHDLPTRLDRDFKPITEKYDSSNFWDIYQSKEPKIWAHFENLLACPNFKKLEKIFDGCDTSLYCEKEWELDKIINQVDRNGFLQKSLNEFVANAEKSLNSKCKISQIEKILDKEGHYITFNYTHTLEKIYGVPSNHILHIHGEFGKDNMLFGYPKGNFSPAKYTYDPRMKGRGPYGKISYVKYVDTIENPFEKTARINLYNKCKSFYKEYRTDLLEKFLTEHQCKINQIVVYGHSCEIDYEYFESLNNRYDKANWLFYAYNEKTKNNIKKLIGKCSIKHFSIKDAPSRK